MGLGTDQITITIAANFIPQIWGPQVIMAAESNLVHVPLTWDWTDGGEQKGSQKNIPSVANFTATAKSANTQVTLSPSAAESTTALNMNRHDHAAFLIEDLAAIQSSFNMMKYYTHKAGEAVGRLRDTRISTIIGTFAQIQGSAGVDIGDVQIRNAIQDLDVADAPQEDRALVLYPTQKNALFGIEKYFRADFRGEGDSKILVNGKFGEIYGIPVYISTNVGTTAGARNNALFHREAIATVKQAGPRTQGDYILEYLGHLIVVDCVYGEVLSRSTFGTLLRS